MLLMIVLVLKQLRIRVIGEYIVQHYASLMSSFFTFTFSREVPYAHIYIFTGS